MLKKYGFATTLLSLSVFYACQKDNPYRQYDETLAGGDCTVEDASSHAYENPASNLSALDLDRHTDGDAAFDQIFVTAPADLGAGLGPIHNANACSACHARNGRAFPPAQSSLEPVSGLLLRLSVAGSTAEGAPMPVPGFGGQFQPKSNFGVAAEGQYQITYQSETVSLQGGDVITLQHPFYALSDTYIPLPADVFVSPRIAPPVFGMGLLEAITQADILENEDISDVDGDGISGKANWGWDRQTNQTALGRFGWKAAAPSILQQTAEAFQQDMGVTSYLFPDESCNGQSNCTGTPPAPDISDDFLELTAFYCQTLGVPAARDQQTPTVRRGRNLFLQARCDACHIPHFTTGDFPIEALAHQEIFPYTDLLLHDMGDGLADHRTDFLADGREWRTPPLWGIGLTEIVNGHTRFLHDGRARNITEAILWHGGEAETAKIFFQNLSNNDRTDILRFLQSL